MPVVRVSVMALRPRGGEVGSAAIAGRVVQHAHAGVHCRSTGGFVMRAKRTTALLVVVAAAICAALAGNVKSAVAAGPTITIWADQDRKASVTQLASAWAAARGANVNV